MDITKNDGDLGELLMILGDLYVPNRSLVLPLCFKKLLKTDKIKRVICTGNVGSKEMYDELLEISPTLHIVQGDYDIRSKYPEQLIISIGNYKIGVINGYQIPSWGNKELLLKRAMEMEVDLLIHGHSHISDIYKYSGKVFVNPGSATGAFQPWQPNAIPTFMLMAIQGQKIVIYVYEDHNGEAQVIMTEVDQLENEKVIETSAQLVMPQVNLDINHHEVH
ncbi:vacuolar protein sorting 29, putative [Theileria equi strain WA]|uniref:Vacuolar protein sorting-associated protein 29 n=1 Tax=Theileria equi strain WA TaxID=1537102 RepID=L0B1D8_THEEQ|nr:vacuolar protein sorting 29, putative [Theileria equi strain WA]AFZ81645.1 vacuolar protein sorting 29, putative [Theileria equi strain WA]|eukprot:XP_004831311.1 vacuolar protein sorting 29, putative [Theileria equi strain WA]